MVPVQQFDQRPLGRKLVSNKDSALGVLFGKAITRIPGCFSSYMIRLEHLNTGWHKCCLLQFALAISSRTDLWVVAGRSEVVAPHWAEMSDAQILP